MRLRLPRLGSCNPEERARAKNRALHTLFGLAICWGIGQVFNIIASKFGWNDKLWTDLLPWVWNDILFRYIIAPALLGFFLYNVVKYFTTE